MTEDDRSPEIPGTARNGSASASVEPGVDGGARSDATSPSRSMVICIVIVNLLLTSGAIAAYDCFFAQKVVSLDIKGYLVQQRDLYLAGKINEKEFEKNLDALEIAVRKTPKQKIIVMGDAIVRPGEVITP